MALNTEADEIFSRNRAIGTVALDADHAVWNAWGNHYWPAFYLYDSAGRLRVQHYGEGAYQSTEDAIRALLGVDPDSPRADVR